MNINLLTTIKKKASQTNSSRMFLTESLKVEKEKEYWMKWKAKRSYIETILSSWKRSINARLPEIKFRNKENTNQNKTSCSNKDQVYLFQKPKLINNKGARAAAAIELPGYYCLTFNKGQWSLRESRRHTSYSSHSSMTWISRPEPMRRCPVRHKGFSNERRQSFESRLISGDRVSRSEFQPKKEVCRDHSSDCKWPCCSIRDDLLAFADEVIWKSLGKKH